MVGTRAEWAQELGKVEEYGLSAWEVVVSVKSRSGSSEGGSKDGDGQLHADHSGWKMMWAVTWVRLHWDRNLELAFTTRVHSVWKQRLEFDLRL